MAEILSDLQLKTCIGSIIVNGSEDCIGPNSIALRLGNRVLFESTQEEMEITKGKFLSIKPGETVMIASYEKLNFSESEVSKLFPNSMLMGILFPTTTMIREALSLPSTKVDPGYIGVLNWSIRNNSSKPIILGYCQNLFNLRIEKLADFERPTNHYGSREIDVYQNSEGIKRSSRTLPVDIPNDMIIESNIDKLDPVIKLKGAGYPFNFIGSELDAIKTETNTLSEKVDRVGEKIDKQEEHLTEKFKDWSKIYLFNIISALVACIAAGYGAIIVLSKKFDEKGMSIIAFVIAALAILIFLFIRPNKKKI